MSTILTLLIVHPSTFSSTELIKSSLLIKRLKGSMLYVIVTVFGVAILSIESKESLTLVLNLH